MAEGPANQVGTRRAYCKRCGVERRVVITVPWQEDFCARCGGAVE